MIHISIISAYQGFQHKSYRASLFFKKYFEENNFGTAEILDIKKFDFINPDNIFKINSSGNIKRKNAGEKLRNANGVIIVTPVCDDNYPVSFKNVMMFLNKDWQHLPVAIATVSTGPFHRSAFVIFIRLVLWKILSRTIPAFAGFPKEIAAYDKKGNATNKIVADKLAAVFIQQLLEDIKTADGTTPLPAPSSFLYKALR